MPLKIIDFGTPEYEQMVVLRQNVLRTPLGLTYTQQELDTEKDSIFIVSSENSKILGGCILKNEGEGKVRLRQMAVTEEFQRKGLGRNLMRFAENVARDMGYRTLIMHARNEAIGFYEKLGYVVTGEEFTEVTIPHRRMEKEL